MTTKHKVIQIASGLAFSLILALLPGKPLSAQVPNAGDARGQWTTTGSLNAARTDHTATLLLDGRVLVVGVEVTEFSTARNSSIPPPGRGT